MSAHNIGIYFSQNEARELLNHYSKLVHEGKAEKIDYNVYRALKDSTYGFYVNEDEDAFGECVFDLFTTDGKSEIYVNSWGEKHFIKNGGDKFLGSFKMDSDFGYFLYTEYLLHRSDYSPHKKNRSETMKSLGNVTNEDYETWTNSATVNTAKIYNTYTNKVEPYDGLLSQVSLTDAYSCKTLKELVDERIEVKLNKKEEKEKDSMIKGINFDFGPCTNDNVRMSMYGLAVKNGNGEWVSYNASTKQIVNVDILNFDGGKYMFKMPVAIKDIAVGDIIIHNRVPMFVIKASNEGNAVTAVDVRAGEEKKIFPTTSPFGFNFVTKVVSMFTAFESTPTPDAPFGNFLPFVLMGEDNKEIDPLMLMMMMQGNGGTNMFSNPMMLYFLCGDKMKDNVLPLMMMMNQPAAVNANPGK
jgi:hypothetical protein